MIESQQGCYIFHGYEALDHIPESHPQYSYQTLVNACEIKSVTDLVEKKYQPIHHYLPCKRLSEEAQICSLILRETLLDETKSCAVITNNVDLIRMIKQTLKIWDIEINDSSAEPLDQAVAVLGRKVCFWPILRR